MIKKYKHYVTIVVCSLFLLLAVPLPARAQSAVQPEILLSTTCGGSLGLPLTALFSAPKADYLVYVKLGQPQQRATVEVQDQLLSGADCRSIGKVEASGDSWQPVGTWSSLGKDHPTSFSLSSPIIDGLPDANRPSIMVVSKTNPVCVPTADCVVTVDGRQGVVSSTGALLNEDTLQVIFPTDPAKDVVQKVDYFVDGEPAYSTKQLEDFNTRYVGPGKHQLVTVITYQSKQRVVISQPIDRSLGDGVNYLFYSTLYNNRTLVTFLGGLFAVVIVGAALLGVIRKLARRRLWKQTHSTHPNPVTPEHSEETHNPLVQVIGPAPIAAIQKGSTAQRVARASLITLIFLVIAGLIIFMVNGFVLQFYHVDGPSMNTSLASGQRLVVNKLGKTWSRVNRRTYMPNRGDIVVCLKAHSYYDSGMQDYIVKRVIALSGERVVVSDGQITVYNAQNPEGFNPDQGKAWSNNIQKSVGERIDLTVAQGEVFIVGDNRPESVDSRSYGPISTDNIIGTANQ